MRDQTLIFQGRFRVTQLPRVELVAGDAEARHGAGQPGHQQVGEALVCKHQPRQPFYQSLTKAILSN